MDVRQKTSLPWSAHIARGNMSQVHVHHQFGRNPACTTDYKPVADSGIYRTPQVAGATSLRVKAGGNAADAANGAGARSVKITGINQLGDEVSEVIATAGASASASTSTTFIRVYLVTVYESGTYGTQDAGSHVADITIENTAGTQDWAQIQVNGFAASSTGIGSVTVPRNHVGLLMSVHLNVDLTKSTSLIVLKREGILQAAAPYSPITKVQEFLGVSAAVKISFDVPIKFPELSDVGILAKVANGTGSVSVDMEIIMLEAET